MDGMLSQDEINALLQGMDLSDTADGSDTAAPAPESSTLWTSPLSVHFCPQ